jgi:hypothetical protein
MFDVRVKRLLAQGWENSPLFATKIVVCFKGLGFGVIFLLRIAADVFFVWCRRTPLDKLYGITNPLIDVNRGLYKPVGIHKVLAFHSEKKTSYGRLLPFFIAVPVFLQKRTCASFSVQTSFDSSASVVSPMTFLKNVLSQSMRVLN